MFCVLLLLLQAWARRRDLRVPSVALHSPQLLSLDKVSSVPGASKAPILPTKSFERDSWANGESTPIRIKAGTDLVSVPLSAAVDTAVSASLSVKDSTMQ